jgi:hypothetical protein
MTDREKAKAKPMVAVAEVLPEAVPTSPQPPPLEREQPHRLLARANTRHLELTTELRELRASWAKRNIQAQQTRIAISTPEITHVENKRRELHLALEATQDEIGRLNRLVQEGKAARQARQAGKPRNGDTVEPKRMPLGSDPEFPTYFVLTAKNELAPALYRQVERTALAMIADARKMGLD